MFDSLALLRDLPDELKVYPGHACAPPRLDSQPTPTPPHSPLTPLLPHAPTPLPPIPPHLSHHPTATTATPTHPPHTHGSSVSVRAVRAVRVRAVRVQTAGRARPSAGRSRPACCDPSPRRTSCACSRDEVWALCALLERTKNGLAHAEAARGRVVRGPLFSQSVLSIRAVRRAGSAQRRPRWR